ncbi:Gfo/Idh/MocA family protein [Arthrobacter oryzae]|uniref:Gfo/Idh/MocA family oxidoreductase n=1 Tax=Arthrobacter oryzae TaxID=409290 RepID=A0A3N0BPX2_9MICC|nr:Gfo/Idh/MocA family oxidoreductase [Arthrobacter oryzae]RNL50392.1 gfo/Idh/MocA family oxidoreductase [Arthrobacter oryzae]
MMLQAMPASRVPDPMDAPVLRWGIMGPGWIADLFTKALQAHTRQVVAAVGSRSLERSEAFAAQHGIASAYGSYEELAASDDVDVVYVATPHNFHHAAAVLALAAGKHVLIEKPIALNAAEARDIRDRAAAAGLMATEALWSFFLPKFDVARQVLESGTLGELTTVITEYGEFYDPSNRIFDPALAGGPLLDLGTYPLALITSMLGEPSQVKAIGTDHTTGVNGQISAIMSFTGGAQAIVNTQLHNFTPTAASLVGRKATLNFDGMFNRPGGFAVNYPDGTVLRYDEPTGAHVDGLHFQAAAVARSIHAGDRGVPERPLSESITTMDVADEIRRQLGIVYPGE